MKFDEFQCGFRIHCSGEFLLMSLNLLVRCRLRNYLKTGSMKARLNLAQTEYFRFRKLKSCVP